MPRRSQTFTSRRRPITIRRAWPEAVNDAFGRQIKVDCTIIYPARKGNEIYLRKMLVKYVRPDVIKGYNPNGRLVTLKNVNNVAVLEYAPQPTLPPGK